MSLQENRRLQEPLNQALKQVEQLRQQLANYEKDKLSLAQTKARLLNAEKQLKNLEWENEVRPGAGRGPGADEVRGRARTGASFACDA